MSDIFIGRQPIFDKDLKVIAYELLFRGDGEALDANVIDGDSATSQVILNTFVNIGLETLVGSHQAFINLTRLFISNPNLLTAPPGQIVLEILEDIEPNETIINTLRKFKDDGHTIALDDFIFEDKYMPLVELADIIKIDIMALEDHEIEEHVAKLKPYNLKLLAEKIETHDEFHFLESLGFDYFQGYFLSKPEIIKGKSIAPNQVTVLELVAKINNPNVELDELSQIISRDVSVSHKVLKYINSPMSGLSAEVDSIQQAVVLLGLSTIKNWVTVLALATGSNKSSELPLTAMVRGKCCELLAKECKLPKPESYFTVGLFSTLDAMMDQELSELLDDLPLSSEAKLALLDHEGVFGEALKCTLSMEKNDSSLIGFKGLDMTELSDIYLLAIQWSDDLVSSFN